MKISSAFQRFDTANLRLRLISAGILMPVVLFGVYWGGILYAAIAICALAIGLYEWMRLVAPRAGERLVSIACAMLGAVMMMGWLFSMSLAILLAVAAMVVLFGMARAENPTEAGLMAFGIPYMAGSGLALLALRGAPLGGAGLAFYVLMAVWGTDIGAYAAGRMIGGAKLAPAISPSKTWAGLFGGMALAAILGYFAARMGGAARPATALVLSPVLACVAQAGDLFESYFKRRAGVKESGDLIPGHGGVLDRIDGLVFAAIAAALFQAFAGQQMKWW